MQWIKIWYAKELDEDPPSVAVRLRELAEDPQALAGLAELAGQPTERSDDS